MMNWVFTAAEREITVFLECFYADTPANKIFRDDFTFYTTMLVSDFSVFHWKKHRAALYHHRAQKGKTL